MDGDQVSRFNLLEDNQANFSPTSRFFASRSEIPDFRTSEDFGRESLGIIDLNSSDFRRESLFFLCNPSGDLLPRESLGILNLENMDLGRDSIAISGLPDVLVTNSRSMGDISLISERLNTGFMLSASKMSVGSSTSSINPSFSDFETTATSQIFSVTPSTINNSSCKGDVFNDGFRGTLMLLQQLQEIRRCSFSAICNELEKKRHETLNALPDHLRIKSLPCELESKNREKEIPNVPHNTAASGNDSIVSFLNNVNDDDVFEDSVFIEANHIASRLASGSILEENDMLDTTNEPEDFVDITEDAPTVKYDTETVFKAVDKALPPSNSNIPTINMVCSEEKTEKESHCSCSSSSNGGSSSSNANQNSTSAVDLLNSLSEILNHDIHSPRQKSEGKHLINSLVEILVTGNTPTSSQNLDDSGLEAEPGAPQDPECFEILDLRTSASEPGPLDLSLRSPRSDTQGNVFVSPKAAAPRTNIQKSRSLSMSLNSSCADGKAMAIATNAVASVSINEFRSFTSVSSKFKPKKSEEKKKGPLKAVIPISSMKRGSGIHKSLSTTPSRLLPKSGYKLKKTSTPISEPKLKPMAQSTPDGYLVNNSPSYQVSPLATDNNSSSVDLGSQDVKQKLNYSSDSTSGNQFLRNRSTSDLKKPCLPKERKLLVRSFSYGKASPEVQSSASKAREMVAIKKRASLNSICDSALRENMNKSGSRLPSLKRFGKENAVH